MRTVDFAGFNFFTETMEIRWKCYKRWKKMENDGNFSDIWYKKSEFYFLEKQWKSLDLMNTRNRWKTLENAGKVMENDGK